MSEVAAALVAWLAVYTFPVVALTVLVSSIGVPLPSTVVVLAAGALSVDGDLNVFALFGVILAAAVVGDVAGYSLGRWASHLVVDRVGARIGLTQGRIEAAEHQFERWGGLMVLVSRFLLTGLAAPTNLVAGASTYPLARFVAFVLLGEAIWAGQFLALGWLFGPAWVSLLDLLNDVATVVTTLALAVTIALILKYLLRTKAGAERG